MRTQQDDVINLWFRHGCFCFVRTTLVKTVPNLVKLLNLDLLAEQVKCQWPHKTVFTVFYLRQIVGKTTYLSRMFSWNHMWWSKVRVTSLLWVQYTCNTWKEFQYIWCKQSQGLCDKVMRGLANTKSKEVDFADFTICLFLLWFIADFKGISRKSGNENANVCVSSDYIWVWLH